MLEIINYNKNLIFNYIPEDTDCYKKTSVGHILLLDRRNNVNNVNCNVEVSPSAESLLLNSHKTEGLGTVNIFSDLNGNMYISWLKDVLPFNLISSKFMNRYQWVINPNLLNNRKQLVEEMLNEYYIFH